MCLILHAGSGTCLGDRRFENSMAPDARVLSNSRVERASGPQCCPRQKAPAYRDTVLSKPGKNYFSPGSSGEDHTGQTVPPYRRRGPPRS